MKRFPSCGRTRVTRTLHRRVPGHLAFALCLLLHLLLDAPRLLLAQGSLTPPGAPAPTMKTLDQIEARTPISSLPYTISASGSYYLTKNLAASGGTAGITVSADNVTIDLGGFALVGGGSGGVAGISVPNSQTNLCVRNGTVTGWTNGGIAAANTVSSLYEKLRLMANTGDAGLRAGSGSLIKDCVATTNSGVNYAGIRAASGSTVVDCTSAGIVLGNLGTVLNSTCNGNSVGIIVLDYCTVAHCTVSGVHDIGISAGNYCSITHCTDSANGSDGIDAGLGCNVEACTASNNPGNGITVSDGCTVRSCTVRGNHLSGIAVGSNCYVVANTCDSNNTSSTNLQAGIVALGTGDRIEANSMTLNNYAGLLVGNGQTSTPSSGAGNLVIGNTFRGAEYIIPPGNTVGTLVEIVAGGTLSANASSWSNVHYY